VRSKLKDIEEKDRIRNFQPPIDGLQIMEMFHLPAGKVVGELKSAIKDAILDGLIPNEYDAVYDFLLKIAREKELTVV
jgi:poly(A) polymerase